MQTYVYIEDYKESLDDRKYDRFITKSIEDINKEDVHKIIYFSKDGIYLVYTKVTLEDVCFKNAKRWIKHNNS